MPRSGSDTDRTELQRKWATFWPLVNEGAQLFGGSLVSGLRSSHRNKDVGGHPESRHLLGLAADITFLPDRERDARKRCHDCFEFYRAQGLRGYIKSSGTSLHIQDRAARAPERG